MDAMAVVLEEPEKLAVRRVTLTDPVAGDLVVEVEYSGISTGTERLLYTGRMPTFPGMGYPLVPGYESIGRVSAHGPDSRMRLGQRVFVPGARCFGDLRGLFGGAASRLVVAESRVMPIDEGLGEKGILLALAATAYHAIAAPGAAPPDLIVGHGVLGRLLARIVVGLGHPPPTVWEQNPQRAAGAEGYLVLDMQSDPRRDYMAIYDVSGDSTILDRAIERLKPNGEVVLAGFYTQPLAFAFAPAFMREARIRVAAEWKAGDLSAVQRLLDAGPLSLEGLITHREPAANAEAAYRVAFNDASCLKMVLDWRSSTVD